MKRGQPDEEAATSKPLAGQCSIRRSEVSRVMGRRAGGPVDYSPIPVDRQDGLKKTRGVATAILGSVSSATTSPVIERQADIVAAAVSEVVAESDNTRARKLLAHGAAGIVITIVVDYPACNPRIPLEGIGEIVPIQEEDDYECGVRRSGLHTTRGWWRGHSSGRQRSPVAGDFQKQHSVLCWST